MCSQIFSVLSGKQLLKLRRGTAFHRTIDRDGQNEALHLSVTSSPRLFNCALIIKVTHEVLVHLKTCTTK